MKIEITDQYGPRREPVVVEHYAVADTVRPWFPDAPPFVLDAIDQLQDGLNRGVDITGAAEFLGLLVHTAD